MKKSLLKINGLMALAVFSLVLLISSPVAATPASVPTIQLDALSETPNLEFADVVAGKDSSVYASIFAFGGTSGDTTYPVDTTAEAFADARSWFVLGLNQGGFAAYLNRAPSPVAAPDGISLHIQYTGLSASQTLSRAGSAAAAVESVYGITFALYYIDTSTAIHSYIFYNDTSLDDVSDDVAGISDDGFSSQMDASVVNAAPVGWAGYGVRTLAGSQIAMYGMGWVDADGVVEDSTDTYTISTEDIFGDLDSNPNIGSSEGLSRVSIRVPYPIEPVENGIVPAQTSNPLPHVTGIMDWDLRHPITGLRHGSVADFSVTFNLKETNAFPNVETTFEIDQAKLENEGTLEGTFTLTNQGDQAAQNLEVFFPLGPDITKLNGKSIYSIKDDYNLDETHTSSFSLDVLVDLSGVTGVSNIDFTEAVLEYSGWYEFADNSTLAGWDLGTSSVEIFNQNVNYDAPIVGTVSVPVTVNIDSTNGFPQVALDAINDQLIPALSSISDYNSLVTNLEDKIEPAFKQGFKDALDQFYEQKQIFLYNDTASDLDYGTNTYWINPAQTETYSFLSGSVASLAANGGTAELKFVINNIPAENVDTFQFIEYEESDPVVVSGIELPQIQVNSSEQNYFEFMQYMFEKFGFDGRPLSYGFNAQVDLNPSGLALDQGDEYYFESYVSRGAIIKYQNSQFYDFFSLSNSVNLQLADDEAVVTAGVSLNSSVYNPGDTKEITVSLSNTGTLAAENIKVHIYHAGLGRGLNLDRLQKIESITLNDALAAGASTSVTVTTEANSFVGYSPVFAIVEFDSDVGQLSETVPDFEGEGITEFRAGGETHHFAYSNLAGSLLAPASPSLNPTVKEPNVEISKDISEVDFDTKEFTVTYTLENTGEAATTAHFGQGYDTNQLSYVAVSTTASDAAAVQFEDGDFGGVGVGNIYLAVDASETVTITFEMLGDGATLWPAYAYFTIAGESSLGKEINTGAEATLGGDASSLFGLSAGSAAQQESQKSATEDSSSSSFSASSSVGAAVNPNVNTEDVTASTPVGFIGFNSVEFLGLMLIPLGIFSLSRRRKY